MTTNNRKPSRGKCQREEESAPTTTTAIVPYDPLLRHHEMKLNFFIAKYLLQRQLDEQQQQQNHTTTMTNVHLVNDIVPNILSYCDAKTLSTCSMVCKEWNEHSDNNDLWEHLCRNVFGVSAKQIQPSPDPTKKLYIWQHRILRQAMSCRRENVFGGGIGNINRITTIPRSSLRPSWS